MDNFNWGVDADGCASICTYDSPVILLCGLPKIPGQLVVDYYLSNGAKNTEDQQ